MILPCTNLSKQFYYYLYYNLEYFCNNDKNTWQSVFFNTDVSMLNGTDLSKLNLTSLFTFPQKKQICNINII